MNNIKRNIKNIAAIFLCAITFLACSGAPTPKNRKKFPMFNSFSDFNQSLFFSKPSEHFNGLPFGGTELEFLSSGKFTSYTYIPMGDAQSDSLVLNLINTYKPFAIPMLSEWSKQYKKGVLIDFRPKPGAGYASSEFNLESPGSFSFPVIFIYDGHSASRAAVFIGTLQGMPMLKAISINAEKGLTTSHLSCY